MQDGSITISTKLDNADLERELSKMKKQIEKLEQSTSAQEAKKAPLVQQAQELEVRMREARAEVDRYRSAWAAGVSGADKEQSEAISKTQQLEAEHAKVVAQIDKIDAKLQPAYQTLDEMKDSAGGLVKKLAEASDAASPLEPALKKADDVLNRFANRVKGLARRVFVFTLITAALRSMRSWMGKVIKTNSEATAAIARLKGALLTMAQPLVDIVIPVFITLVNILTQVASALAQVFATLTGRTIDDSKAAAEALNSETEAIEGTGTAAQKAEKQLAGFDEINKLSSGNAGGGGAGSKGTAPDFSFIDISSDRLKSIADAVMLIGAGFALWKISDLLPGRLGDVATKLAGIAIAIGGLILLWDGLKDAWDNGIDWGNLIEMLVGAATAVGGLSLAFGKLGAAISLIVTGLALFTVGIKDAFENGVNWKNLISILAGATAAVIGLYLAFGKVGAGIGLVVTGITMLITGFRDVMENGANLQNTLLIIAGIVSTGLGISLLTGNLLPALVAGILAVIYAFVAWQGNAEELAKNLKLILSGIIDFLLGTFTGDWERAWKGLKDVFRGIINSILIIFESVINGVIAGINFLIEKINTLHWDIPEWVPGIGGESFGFSIKKLEKVSLPRIPELAQGAVIPPNREFLAVLGDQKSGTNIEAPLDTIVQAVMIALAKSGYGGNAQVIENVLNLDGEVIYRNQKKVERRHGVSLANR